MDCLHPIFLRGGYVPCGRCPACRINRQRDWTFRLKVEKDAADFTFWLTLTYDDLHLPHVGSLPALDKSHCRHFFEALRKHFKKRVMFKHYLVSEYGDKTERPHYHCLLFAYCDAPLSYKLQYKQEILDFVCGENSTAWPFGFAYVKKLHRNVYGYVTNYVNKPELLSQNHPVKPFAMISQGIGIDFLNRRDFDLENENFRVEYSGKFYNLPRYYREKLLKDKKADYQAWMEHTLKLHENARQRLIDRIYKENRFNSTHDVDIWTVERQSAKEFERRYIEKLKKRNL